MPRRQSPRPLKCPRRRRSSRSRRRGAGEEETGVAEPETTGTSAAPTAPPVGQEPAVETDAASVRTRRRGGRSRRSRTEEDVTATVEVTAEPEPVVVPEPVEIPIDRTVGTHLISRNGLPEIHIHGVVKTPLLFFGNMDGPKNRQRVLSEVRRAAAAGILSAFYPRRSTLSALRVQSCLAGDRRAPPRGARSRSGRLTSCLVSCSSRPEAGNANTRPTSQPMPMAPPAIPLSPAPGSGRRPSARSPRSSPISTSTPGDAASSATIWSAEIAVPIRRPGLRSQRRQPGCLPRLAAQPL